jgi:hypothetical protein
MSPLLLLAQEDNGAGAATLVGGFFLLWVVMLVLVIAANVFWLWMLIDALTSIRDTNEKILWVLVIALLHFIGAVVYFFVRKGRGAGATAGPT